MQPQVILNPLQSDVKPVLGFLGLGLIGRNRMEAICINGCAQVKSLVEPFTESVQKALESARGAVVAPGLEEMVNDKALDGIVIATPSAMHASQSIKALQNGKAVFCQKPLGRTAREVRAVVEASRKSNRLLGVDLSYRYTRAVEAIFAMIRRGELGEIYGIDLTFHNAYGPDKQWFYDISQSGGGCVIDLGIHLIDMALWCLDFPEIESVDSVLYNKGKRLFSCKDVVEDYACARIVTKPGTSINLQCSWNLPAGQDAVISAYFYGTRAGAAFRNINGSFYDFVAEKYEGTRRINLAMPPDNWSGRAAVVWAQKLAKDPGYDQKSGAEYIKTAEIIDSIYGRG
jgi:predicted dehydrogenase